LLKFNPLAFSVKLPQTKSNLKVSVIAPDLSGGGVTRVYLLARVLQKLNYDVKVVGFQFGNDIYPPPPAGLPVYSVRGCDYPQLFNAVPKLLKQIDADLIYAVKPKPTSFGIGLLKKISAQTPILLDIDDWELSWFGGEQWQYRPSLKQLGRDILKKDGALRVANHPLYLKWIEGQVNRADGITVDTQFLQNRFGGTYLPNGKDTSIFDPQKFDPQECRSRYGLAEYRVLMFPGTARPHKGLEDVLVALDQINQPDLRLVIVGGRKPDNYDDQLLEKWGRWIIKLPQYPSEKMAEIVAAAHIVVVPQRKDPTALAQFPLKLTDGMAMAKPILATRVGDIPDILAQTGYLVDPNNPEQIAAKIQWIFANFELAQAQGKRARERCVADYSVDAMTGILSEVIANL
jgi:glycosyltransferase involved in cell wall biosynthesis